MSWNAEWPTEGDAGRIVEIELADGRVVQGPLLPDPDAEHDPEDAPLFVVQDDAGVTHRLVNAVNWRFAERRQNGPSPVPAGGNLAQAALELQRRVRYLEMEMREAIQPLLQRFVEQTGLAPSEIVVDLIDASAPGSEKRDVRAEMRVVVQL